MAAVETNNVLVSFFTASDGDTFTKRYKNPKANLTTAEVSAAMNYAVNNQIYVLADGSSAVSFDKAYVERTTRDTIVAGE